MRVRERARARVPEGGLLCGTCTGPGTADRPDQLREDRPRERAFRLLAMTTLVRRPPERPRPLTGDIWGPGDLPLPAGCRPAKPVWKTFRQFLMKLSPCFRSPWPHGARGPKWGPTPGGPWWMHRLSQHVAGARCCGDGHRRPECMGSPQLNGVISGKVRPRPWFCTRTHTCGSRSEEEGAHT